MNLFPSYPVLVVAVVVAVAAVVRWVTLRRTDLAGVAARRLAVALLLVLIAVRPTIGDEQVVTYRAGVDAVVMIDRTASMAAQDYDGTRTRLEGVRTDLTDLMGQLRGSRVAVVVFDNDARVALPFTTDVQAVVTLAEVIGWREAAYGLGSDIGIGVPTAQELLERSKQERPEVRRMLIYLGDGEQTRPSEPTSFASLRPVVDAGLVLGYGTTAGAPLLAVAGRDDVVMSNGQKAISRADPANLQAIADQIGGVYQPRTAPGGLRIDLPQGALVATGERVPGGFELYWLFAVVASAVLAYDLWDTIGRLLQARQEVAGG